jgi:hypothetical protein
MNPTDLPYYESQGEWCAQRKFNGSRNLIHIDQKGQLTVWGRHGKAHQRFVLKNDFRDEILASLALQKGVEYWLDSELMNKQTDATNEIILYDVLQAGKYFFNAPDQITRLALLQEICQNPQTLEPTGLALQITPRLWMAETYFENFVERFKESLNNPKLEGLVLRKRKAALDNFGKTEYETGNLIRCRKPFAATKSYNF